MPSAKMIDQVVKVTWSDEDPPAALIARGARTGKYQLVYDAIDSMKTGCWRKFEVDGEALKRTYASVANYVLRRRKLHYNVRLDRSKLPKVGVFYLRLLGPRDEQRSV